MKVNGNVTNAGRPVEQEDVLQGTAKATASADSYEQVEREGLSANAKSTGDMFSGFGVPDSAANNSDYIHGGSLDTDIAEVGGDTSAEGLAQDCFQVPMFEDIQAQLEEKIWNEKVMDSIISKYTKLLSKWQELYSQMKNRGDLTAFECSNILEDRLDVLSNQLELAKQFKIELKDIKTREEASLRDLNADGKIGDKYRVVHDIYGRELVIDRNNQIVTMSSYTDMDGNSGLDYCPEIAEGDVSYVGADDDTYIRHFSMDPLMNKWESGKSGYVGFNVPPSILVKVGDDGQMEYINDSGTLRAKNLHLEEDDGVFRQATDVPDGYTRIMVTDVQVFDERSADNPDIDEVHVGYIGRTTDGREVVLMEMVVDHGQSADGTIFSSVGIPIKFDIFKDTKWQGTPGFINFDASQYTPEMYTKYDEDLMSTFGLSDNGISDEKRGVLTGNIKGERGFFDTEAEGDEAGRMIREPYDYTVTDPSSTIRRVAENDPIVASRSNTITTGLVVDVYGAGGKFIGSSGNDVFNVHDKTQYVDVADDYPINPLSAEFTTYIEGGGGENYLFATDAGNDSSDVTYGTIAGSNINTAYVRNTHKEDRVFVVSAESSDNNYRRDIHLGGEGQAYVCYEDDSNEEYMGFNSYDLWRKEGDVVNISSSMTIGDGTGNGGIDDDPDNRDISFARDSLSAVEEIVDDYDRSIDPSTIIDLNEPTDEWDEEDDTMWQEFEAELSGFFSMMDQNFLDTIG